MSTELSFAGYAAFRVDPERWHRRRVFLAAAVALAVIVALAAYGQDYYLLAARERPFAVQHHLLKPSGTVGIKLGMLGTALFILIFMYPVRKRVPWLARRGSAKHWLDFHVVLGLSAPVIIAFHSAFKFRGLAGIAFWIMVVVALSGVVGRYIYAQIPRSLDSATLSLKDLQADQGRLSLQLADQHLFSPADLAPMFDIPAPDDVRQMPVLRVVLLMLRLDLARPFHVARLRAKGLGFVEFWLSGSGLFSSGNRDLERVILAVRQRSTLAKRIAFLERSHRVFHLWHVIHRPFSYTFATLALLHIAAVMLLGFF